MLQEWVKGRNFKQAIQSAGRVIQETAIPQFKRSGDGTDEIGFCFIKVLPCVWSPLLGLINKRDIECFLFFERTQGNLIY